MEKVTEIFVAARYGLVGNAVNLAAYAVRKAKGQKPVKWYPARVTIQRAKQISRYPLYRSPWAISKDRRI